LGFFVLRQVVAGYMSVTVKPK